ncbi:unnamed protein product, partial [Scytosiphon promiscuus]
MAPQPRAAQASPPKPWEQQLHQQQQQQQQQPPGGALGSPSPERPMTLGSGVRGAVGGRYATTPSVVGGAGSLGQQSRAGVAAGSSPGNPGVPVAAGSGLAPGGGRRLGSVGGAGLATGGGNAAG